MRVTGWMRGTRARARAHRSRSRCGQIMMYLLFVIVAAYPAVYSQFPQAIPQPMTAVAPTQREGKYNTLSSTVV